MVRMALPPGQHAIDRFPRFGTHREQPAPAVPDRPVLFGGLDGYWSYALLEDALQPDVLIAERLDGAPLDSDHGAPARLISPGQYGFVSTEHLCLVEPLAAAPKGGFGSAGGHSAFFLRLITRHPRARVWQEERDLRLPRRLTRPLFRALIPPIEYLCRRGGRR
jgi:DMSO/TMAO reductase YedYZ molybdopterin-dependent catalytic subunit